MERGREREGREGEMERGREEEEGEDEGCWSTDGGLQATVCSSCLAGRGGGGGGGGNGEGKGRGKKVR